MRLFSALITVIVATYLTNVPIALADEKVKVGVIMGLSGPLAPVAEKMRKGLELALKESPDIELVYEDDRGMEIKSSVAAAHRLISQEKVKLILNWVNTTMPALVPIANQSKIPVIEFWDSNFDMLNMGPYVFCSGVSTEKSAARAAQFIVQSKKLNSAAIIYLEDPWSEIVAKSFKGEYEKLGGSVLLEERIGSEISELRTVVTKIKQSGAQTIFAPLFLNPLYALIKQSRELGFKGQIFTADGFVESDIGILGTIAEGVYSMQAVNLSDEFVRNYYARNNSTPALASLGYAALAYDAVKLVQAAILSRKAKGENITSEGLRNEFSTMRYEGVTGLANLSGESEKIEVPVIVSDGKFEIAK